MSEKNKPAQQKAYAYIKTQIASAKSREETRLPSIRKMARAAGVSLVPMWEAVSAPAFSTLRAIGAAL